MSTETNDTKLEPCPFCGSPAICKSDSDHHGEFFELGCPNENCVAHWAFYTEPMENLPAAITKWNTRTAPPVALVEQLVAALECDAMWMFDKQPPIAVTAEYPVGGKLTNGPNNCREFYEKRRTALADFRKWEEGK